MIRKFFILALILSALGCAANDEGTEPQLPLPQIPDSLRQPVDRAGYLLAHFWDALDFADTALTHNRPFMEQNFVNFVNLYPHADSALLPDVTRDFLLKATTDRATASMVYELIEKYLSEPESPVRSDDSYITFLEQWVKLPGFDSYELEEPKYRLAAALKNRPGTRAADFSYRTRVGQETTLASTEAPLLLLLFYDPDCDHCQTVIASLRTDPEVQSMIEAGKLRVLAVYTEGNEALWQSTAATMPAEWTVATDLSGIVDNELYDIPEMPGIYLLDGEKKVLLRSPSLSALSEAIHPAE